MNILKTNFMRKRGISCLVGVLFVIMPYSGTTLTIYGQSLVSLQGLQLQCNGTILNENACLIVVETQHSILISLN